MFNYYQKLTDYAQCNGDFVYKLLHNPFYIYKSTNGYWCDSLVESNVVDCDANCTEVRFQLPLNSTSSIIPEQFDHRFRVWVKKNSMTITCINETSLKSSSQLASSLVNGSNGSLPTNEIQVASDLNARIPNNTTSRFGNRQPIIGANLKKPVLLKNANVSSTANNVTNATREPMTPCLAIELDIYENNRILYNFNFTSQDGVDCMASPVYRSVYGSYLYRNVFGEWCHDHIDQFEPKRNCMQPCFHRRLLPPGIRCPSETTAVEIYNQPFASKFIYNYKYKCVKSCKHIGCSNDSVCMLSTSTGQYKCEPKPSFDPCEMSPCLNNGECKANEMGLAYCANCPEGVSGPNCEQIDDICLWKNPCLNNGLCKSKSGQKFSCQCSPMFEGLLCERLSNKNILLNQKRRRFLLPQVTKHSFNQKARKCPQGMIFDQQEKICDYPQLNTT